MNIDEIKQKLAEIDSAIVKDFVLKLYQQYPDLTAAIDTLVLSNDPNALAKALLKRIQKISRSTKFIDWRMNYDFACDLERLLDDIETGLLAQSPKHAFDLVSKFLNISNKVYERCDDSSGDLGGVYQQAVLLWLKTANAYKQTTAAGAKINWLEKVYELYLDNDYAVYDGLLPNSHLLLNHDELTQLAWRYESELKKAVNTDADNEKFSYHSITKLVALQSVAAALKDPNLYERAQLITSPTPNNLQKKSIVEMYLRFNQCDDALRWLSTPWDQRFESDRLRLLDQAYEQNNDGQALKDTRFEIYQRSQSYHDFMHYQSLLTDNEKKSAQQQAITLAQQGAQLLLNVDMLLRLNEANFAQQLLLLHPNDVANGFYDDLLALAKQFEEKQCGLAQTVCYRSLLLSILAEGRTKAYNHAAKYYKKLTLIAENIEDYSPLEHHLTFIQQLEQMHGKKHSFWRRVI